MLLCPARESPKSHHGRPTVSVTTAELPVSSYKECSAQGRTYILLVLRVQVLGLSDKHKGSMSALQKQLFTVVCTVLTASAGARPHLAQQITLAEPV